MAIEFIDEYEETLFDSRLTEGLSSSVWETVARRANKVLASTPEKGDFIANGIWALDLAAKRNTPEWGKLFLLDVRERKAFEAGHIEGAHHTAFTKWAADENLAMLPLHKKIVVICDFGTMSAQVAAGLRMLGFDAAVLRTGMNGWAPGWFSKPVIKHIESASFPVVNTPPEPFVPAPSAAAFDAPSRNEFEIILSRARSVMAVTPSLGDFPFNVIHPARLHEMLNDPAKRRSMFLLDLRREEDFEGVGHIDGAVQVDFKAAVVPENLKRLPQDKKIVTICYTGNTAAQLVMILRMLGYDAAALAYGMVGWQRTPTTYRYLRDLKKAGHPVKRCSS